MEDLKRFIKFLEEYIYIEEGHDIINAKFVLHELRKIAGDGNEGRQKGSEEE